MQNQMSAEIKTERFFLRTLTEADTALVKTIVKDEFEDDKAIIDWIRWINGKKDTRMFFIWLTQTGECIGRVYFYSKPELNDEVEIGYGILEEYRNNGFATEAAKAVVQFAFEKAGQDVLVAIVKPENTASRRVIEKLGFIKRGVRAVPDENNVVCEFDYFQLCRNHSIYQGV